MLQFISSLIGKLRGGDAAAEKLPCFHCGDRVRPRHAVSVQFDGAQRIVCCHGCAAILNTVEQMGMVAQYREQKTQSIKSNE